jgi:hypothetical protein
MALGARTSSCRRIQLGGRGSRLVSAVAGRFSGRVADVEFDEHANQGGGDVGAELAWKESEKEPT